MTRQETIARRRLEALAGEQRGRRLLQLALRWRDSVEQLLVDALAAGATAPDRMPIPGFV